MQRLSGYEAQLRISVVLRIGSKASLAMSGIQVQGGYLL